MQSTCACVNSRYPLRRRATALSIYSCGIPLGIAIGYLLGGWVNEWLGWRLNAWPAFWLGNAVFVALLVGCGWIWRELRGRIAQVHWPAASSG